MIVNIHSSLQMPSNVPDMTILSPDNCALAIKRMFALNSRDLLNYKYEYKYFAKL